MAAEPARLVSHPRLVDSCPSTSSHQAGGRTLNSTYQSSPSRRRDPDLYSLFHLFPPAVRGEGTRYEEVPAEDVPPPYHGLLVHEHHMTVTVEAFHGDRVDVRILNRRLDGDTYARQILLALQQTGRIVQYGAVRIHLRYCSPEVRQEILAGQTPLGRILIRHDVLRRIEPKVYLRVIPGKALRGWFGLAEPVPTYGRLALIHCNEQPAIELLEIVVPA